MVQAPFLSNSRFVGTYPLSLTFLCTCAGSEHGGSSDVVVRLGKDSAGAQIELSEELNHISVWCEDFAVCPKIGTVL